MVRRDLVLKALNDLRAKDDTSFYSRAREVCQETGLDRELKGVVFGEPLDSRFRLLSILAAFEPPDLPKARSLVDELITALS